MMKTRIEQLLELWRDVLSILKNAAPSLSIAVTAVTLIEAIMTLLVLYTIKLLVDSISAHLASAEPGISAELIYVLCATGGVILLAALAQNLAAILRMRQGFLVSDYVDREIHGRAIAVGLRYYESPEYYDALERAREGGSRRPAQLISNVVISFRAMITLVGVLVLISSIEYRLLPVLLIPILIALFIRIHHARKLFKWRMSRAQKERRASYLDFVMTKAAHAKDLRINGIGPFFRDQFSKIREELRNGETEIEQARILSDFMMVALGAIVFVAASTWLLAQSLGQDRPIGDVVLFVLLLRRAETSGREMVGNISNLVDDHLFLRRLTDFLSVPIQNARTSRPSDLPIKFSSGLELADVTFQYDATEYPALRNVSMQLRPGQIVALVGENGSGKTTLIKLLTRLYDPTQGHVLLEGQDVREFDPHAFRALLSVVFQDYAIYADTVAENIRFGEVGRSASEGSISEAAEKAGASGFIEALPDSYETQLTKIFDKGHDLSIGQWQRIALARSLYATSKFLILDEPTSAMDAKAEFELFENFRTRIGDRGALIISHRLSTIRQADYIYVMADGEIVEQGTHDELVSLRGRYDQLFRKQAKHYR